MKRYKRYVNRRAVARHQMPSRTHTTDDGEGSECERPCSSDSASSGIWLILALATISKLALTVHDDGWWGVPRLFSEAGIVVLVLFVLVPAVTGWSLSEWLD